VRETQQGRLTICKSLRQTFKLSLARSWRRETCTSSSKTSVECCGCVRGGNDLLRPDEWL